MAFGVKTANMFELLGDEEGAPATTRPAKAQAEAKKPAPELSGAANVEARLKGGVANGPVSNANGRGEGRGGGRGRGRGGRGYDRQREGGDGGGEGGDGERAPRPYRGRGQGGRHYERDFNRRGYDRHDGTGRGHETEKKGGHGGHNWGAPGEEEAPVTEGQEHEPQEELAAATDAPAAAEAAGEATAEAPAEPAEPEEPEKEEMTLDEWEKQQEEKRGSLKKKPTTAVKVDTTAFKGMKAYDPKEAKEDNSYELTEKKQLGKSKSGGSDKVRKEKELLPTGFRVGSNEGGRGRGRGDRGGRFNDKFGDRPERPPRRSDEQGGRGYGRGSGRGDRPFSGGRGRGRDGPPPTISDNQAFPTLGA